MAPRFVRRAGVAVAALALAVVLPGKPSLATTPRIERSQGHHVRATAAHTTIAISTVTTSGGRVGITGTLTLGSDALGAFTIGTDPAGDASPEGLGLDLGNITVTPDLVKQTLTFDLALNDAIPTGGTAPAAGVGVPIVINGDDETYWLGAGNAASNQTETGNWTGLCNNKTSTGGWDCSTSLAGSTDTKRIQWVLPFSKVPPGITPGSVVENDGGVYAGAPASFFWPSDGVTYGIYTADVEDVNNQYLVPGGVQLAVTKAGVAPKPSDFVGTGSFDPSTGKLTGGIAAPTATGSYTVTVRSCFGDDTAPTCATAAVPLTI